MDTLLAAAALIGFALISIALGWALFKLLLAWITLD